MVPFSRFGRSSGMASMREWIILGLIATMFCEYAVIDRMGRDGTARQLSDTCFWEASLDLERYGNKTKASPVTSDRFLYSALLVLKLKMYASVVPGVESIVGWVPSV